MVHLFTDHFPHRLARSHPSEFEGAPLLSLHSAPPVTWRTEIKRMLDIAVAVSLLLVLVAAARARGAGDQARFQRAGVLHSGARRL